MKYNGFVIRQLRLQVNNEVVTIRKSDLRIPVFMAEMVGQHF
jgi:hypothetical protein